MEGNTRDMGKAMQKLPTSFTQPSPSPPFRMTLYVGKEEAGFYVSKALVHAGVALVVRRGICEWAAKRDRAGKELLAHVTLHPLPQPRGLTLAPMDGPTTDEVTVQVSGEREGSPSTAVRYPSGSVALPRQWLLIGEIP